MATINTTITKEELNSAIYEVISHQLMRDAKEAHKIVKVAGYVTYKNNFGGYTVSNPDTNKTVSMRQGYSATYITHTRGTKSAKTTREAKKVDFVAILETPLNKEWLDLRYYKYMPSKVKMAALEEARRMVRYSDEEISRVQRQIEKLQKELIYEAQRKERKQAELQKLRKELGLRR